MTRTIFSLVLGALLAFGAQAQDSKPAAANPAAEAAKPEPGPGQEPDPKIIENIIHCMADGLAQDWQKAWVVVKQIDRNAAGNARQFEATIFSSNKADDPKGQPLRTCGAETIVENVGALNAYLTDSQKRWTGATFMFYRDGRYHADYDYTPVKPKPAAKAAPKAGSKKKKQEVTK